MPGDLICAHCGKGFHIKRWVNPKRRYCSQSCGAHASKNRRHGLSDNAEHRTWTRIRERCNNPNHGDYPRYGGRGIKVCARWDSFENFLADMGPRNGLTIDRIDGTGDYEPGNCRWATVAEQNRNKCNLYTADQDHKIREAIALGLNFRQMAEYVGKSRLSVMARAYRIGLKSGQPLPQVRRGVERTPTPSTQGE